MMTNAFILVFLTSYTFVTGEVYSTCYDYETYCLFSFGPNVTVNNVSEAQKICEDAKNGSWLLKIIDIRTLKNVNEFLSNHSFPVDTKWILNAETSQSKLHIIINNNIISSNDMQFLQLEKQTGQNKNESERFSIICMTGCSSEFEEYNQTRIVGATGYKNTTPDGCKEKCEMSTCEAYEWDSNSDPNYNNCWIHTSITGKDKSGNINGTLYVIERSFKTTDVCVGNITEPTVENSHWNEYHGTNSDMKVLCIILVILLFAIIFTSVIIFWRRRKNRKEHQKSTTPAVAPSFSVSIHDGSSSATSPSSQRLETEQQYKQIEGIVYADLLLFQKVDKTAKESFIIGPMGDVYAQVKRK